MSDGLRVAVSQQMIIRFSHGNWKLNNHLRTGFFIYITEPYQQLGVKVNEKLSLCFILTQNYATKASWGVEV
jgi:hypothetical protein